MPKINRIRIANIEYDKKMIKDLFLDCYGGENVLLNLANGGGKSVLVQLLAQPLMPESKIQNRAIYSYLTSNQPAYILIEWKLDHSSKNYLLTGIVMKRLFSNEDMNKTKYFTFIHEYRTANEFDIKNIPFIQKQENAVIYASYEMALKRIRENHSFTNLNVYSREDQRAYRQKLSEYGIFQNEWKILAKMNENEGGVDELFKDCKTSDSLVNKWILKTISDSNEEESRQLKEMFVSLMQEIVEQEDRIKEKEILEEFKKKVEAYEEPMKLLLEQLEEEQQIEKNLHDFYASLQKLSRENQEKIEQIAQKMLQGDKELEQLDYEEKSEEFYRFQSDFEALKEQREEKQEEVEQQRKVLEKANEAYRLQKVAYFLQEKKRVGAQIETLEFTRNHLEEENRTDEQIVKIEYNLQEIYKAKMAEFSDEMEKLGQENQKIKENLQNWKGQKEDTQKQMSELNVQIGGLQEKMNQFLQEEKVLYEKMALSLTRNLLNELEEKEVQEVKHNLDKQIEQLQREQKESQEQIEALRKQIEKAEQKIEENNCAIEELTKQSAQKTMEYEAYQKQEEKVKQILEFHRMNEYTLFQKQAYLPMIQEKAMEYKRKIEELVSQIDRNKKYLVDLEQGELHHSRAVKSALEKAEIEYITGEKYLRDKEVTYQKQLLEKNPLLPYCYIVEPEDLEKIKALEIKEESSKLAPIISYHSIGKARTVQKQMVALDEIYFLSLYHKECFSGSVNQYKEKLEEQLQTDKIHKLDYEKQLKTIQEHIDILEKFDETGKDKQEEIFGLEREIQKRKEENGKQKEQKQKCQQEQERQTQEIQQKQAILEKKQQEKTEFLSYLDKNLQYGKIIKQNQEARIQWKTKKLEIESLEKQTQEAQTQEKQNFTKKNDLQYQQERIKSKQIRLPRREKQEKLELSLEELEAQYEVLTQKYEQDKKQLDDQITIWKHRKLEIEKQIQKDYADLDEAEVCFMVYSEQQEDFWKESKEQAEKALQQMKEERDKIEIQYTRIETRFQTSCKELEKIGKKEPLEAYRIKGNYAFRKNKIEQDKQEGLTKQKEYEEKNKNIQKQLNEIERNVEIKSWKEAPLESKIQAFDLQELLQKYRILKEKNQKYKEEIYRQQVQINQTYKNKHTIITTFLENISMQGTEGMGYDSYYYIYEKMLNCLKMLIEYIQVIDVSLKSIEEDKKNILQHATKRGIMLYQEIKKISASARIRIGGRYIQILNVEVPQELKGYVEQRIQNHLENCIQTLREECKQSPSVTKTIESKIAIYLSDRRLLNLALDVETIQVKLYKFDIEKRNSGLRYWEDVIIENSGGQKFIACFALISALIEYTRREELEKLGEDEKIETSKVFILDNPFGKTSSKHLLEPMVEIAKKFNTQMICLSDLSQSSITDKFSLIYQLALRNSKYTNQNFLIIENSKINGDIVVDTFLEQVFVRNQFEQMSF